MPEERPGRLRTKVYGERTVYDNRWVRLVQVDIEPPDGRRWWHHVVRSEPTDAEEAGIVRWIPLADVRGLMARGEVLGSGSLVGLLWVLTDPGSGDQC